MNANEKAQRLALVTNVKFRLDNKTGDIVESELPVLDEVVKEAMEMPDEVFKARVSEQKKQGEINRLLNDVGVRCAYKAYYEANPTGMSFDVFVSGVLDDIESEKGSVNE